MLIGIQKKTLNGEGTSGTKGDIEKQESTWGLLMQKWNPLITAGFHKCDVHPALLAKCKK